MGNSCSLCCWNCLGPKSENFNRLADERDSMGAGVVKPQPDGRGGIRIHISPGNNHTAPLPFADERDSMGAGVVKPQPDGRGGIRIHISPGNNHSALPPFADERDSMGAGVVKPQPDGRGGIRIHISPGNNHTAPPFGNSTNQGNRPKPESNSCEECGQAFSPFRKKKTCKDCVRNFCSNCCVNTGASSPRLAQCKKCQILLTGTFSRSLLADWKIKDLKALLVKQNVNTSKCKEKDDLIELIFVYFGGNRGYDRQTSEQERFVEQLAERMRLEQETEQQSTNQNGQQSNHEQNQPSTHETQNRPVNPSDATNTAPNTLPSDTRSRDSNPSSSSSGLESNREQNRPTQEEENDKKPMRPDNPNLKLSDIKTIEEIEELNIKSLKRLLLNNFVDYKGCVERWELKERVKRLWIDNENNKKRAEEILKDTDNPGTVPSTSGGPSEDDICKICMDAAIDCVLLECGHMVTCTQCGKRLAECPICRQFVVRAVHTFRS